MEARKTHALPLVPPSSESRFGAAGEARGGAAPRSSFLSGLLGKTAIDLGREWYRTATREQLIDLAKMAAELDRDRAIQAAGLLAWAATGQAPEVKPLSASTLANVAQASQEDLSSFAARLVRFDLKQAHELYSLLGYELTAHDVEFRAWLKERK
jgi:hypothetical protein